MKNPRVNNVIIPKTCAENILKKNSKTCALPFTDKTNKKKNNVQLTCSTHWLAR